MKLITFLIVCSPLLLWAQFTDTRTIEVNGSAQEEVVPDEIHFNITLKEYKDGSRKIEINDLERDFMRALKKLDIADENVSVSTIGGSNWSYPRKRDEEFLARKTFQLMLPDVKKINQLFGELDPKGLEHAYVSKFDHSNLEEIKQRLWSESVQNAKQKATSMLVSLGEEIGPVHYISEGSFNAHRPQYRMAAQSMEAADGQYQSQVEVRTIKIEAEVRAIFTIK